MGLMSKLFGGHQEGQRTVAVVSVAAAISREEMVPIVGESHYQPAIRLACGWKESEDVMFECFAELVPEPDNPHDSNAVRVDIDGQCVGYLPRGRAAEMGPAIAEGIETQGTGMCRAVIRGAQEWAYRESWSLPALDGQPRDVGGGRRLLAIVALVGCALDIDPDVVSLHALDLDRGCLAAGAVAPRQRPLPP